MSTARPTEQLIPAFAVSATAPTAWTDGSNGVSDVLQAAGSAHIRVNGAGVALFEVTAVSGLTGTVEVLTLESGTWRTWACYQMAAGAVPTAIPAGTTITLVAGDFIIVETYGFYAVRFKRAGGTSATFTIRTGETDILDAAGISGVGATSTYTTLSDETLPSISSSTQLFVNAPAGTKEIWVTLRTAGMTLTTDAGAATAGANGSDFSSGTVAPHVFRMNQAAALRCRAIQNGGTSTGWIVYRG